MVDPSWVLAFVGHKSVGLDSQILHGFSHVLIKYIVIRVQASCGSLDEFQLLRLEDVDRLLGEVWHYRCVLYASFALQDVIVSSWVLCMVNASLRRDGFGCL